MSRCAWMVLAVLGVWTLATGSPDAVAQTSDPSAAELAALDRLGARVPGAIVWESNRTGQWELFAMNTDGTGRRQLTKLGKKGDARAYTSYLRPRISPDGAQILFAYGKKHAPAEAWTIPTSGGKAKKITRGCPLNWAPDSRRFYFVRGSQIWEYDLRRSKERVFHKAKVPTTGREGSMVGRLHPDGRSAVFRTPQRNEYFLLDQATTAKTMGGCEPQFTNDGRYLYWVGGPKNFRIWDIKANSEEQLLGTPATKPFNYTYFPTITPDGKWLLYGASPGEHSHDSSDYEAYIVPVKDYRPSGDPIRLSFHKRTDRWPFLWAGPSRLLPVPQRPKPVASAPGADIPVFTFAADGADPEFGGDWGLWPQTDGCKGDTAFVGEDSEGGEGGAMRVDYTIAKDPKSFSLWISSGDGPVDLSACDRLVLYAKGSVPSFTLVVKDQSAEDPDAPEGIADFAVTGITGDWRRFELAFSGFVTRKAGARVDWGTVNHLGVAMIAPRDRPEGTLFIDNIRVQPAAAAPRDRAAGKLRRTERGLLALYRCGKEGPALDGGQGQSDKEIAFAGELPNGVVSAKDRIVFTKPALVASTGPGRFISAACQESGEVTVEAWVKPSTLRQDGPARIFTLSRDSNERDFTLGQAGAKYVFRLRTTGTSTNGLPSLQSPDGSLTSALTHVVFTRDRLGMARLFLDGEQVSKVKLAGDLSNWDQQYRLGLGNELTGDRPWLGEIRLTAVYSRALSSREVVANHRAGL